MRVLAGHSTAQAVIPAGNRVLQSLQSIQLGAFTDMQAGFLGSMAHVVALHTTVTPQQALYVFQVRVCYGSRSAPHTLKHVHTPTNTRTQR